VSYIVCSCERAVFDELVILKDGESRVFKLEPGTYKLEVTASGDGAAIEWIGSDCPGSNETKSYSVTCTFERGGQVIISNPTTFGMGTSSSVTIKLTKSTR
jgi:hypothetical protein